ncbi:hypothetical protein VR45_10990 [Streptomyces sp. NRRL S-495]|nr:hypothetical protein VR45_10990 [Streptomyces sp. NRRL S-495]
MAARMSSPSAWAAVRDSPKTVGQWPQLVQRSENQCMDSAVRTTSAWRPAAAATRSAASQLALSASSAGLGGGALLRGLLLLEALACIEPQEVVEQQPVGGGVAEQAQVEELVEHLLDELRAQAGEGGARPWAEVRPRDERQPAEEAPHRLGELFVGEPERRADAQIPGGQALEAQILVPEPLGEAARAPGGPAQQPVARDAQRQRQVPAQRGDPRQHCRAGAVRAGVVRGGRPVRTDRLVLALREDRAEQRGGGAGGQRRQDEPPRVLDPGERAAAGHPEPARPRAGQQVAHLGLVGRVVEDDEGLPVPHQAPIEHAALVGLGRQVAFADAQRPQQARQGVVRHDGFGIQAAQVDEEAAVREPVDQPRPGVHHQGGLAQTGRAGDDRDRWTRRGGDAPSEPGGLGLAAGEVGDRGRQVAEAGSRGGRPAPSARAGRAHQLLGGGPGEPQGDGEGLDGPGLGAAAVAALHVADGAGADARFLRQLLQGQPGLVAVLAQQRPQGRWLRLAHPIPPTVEGPSYWRVALTWEDLLLRPLAAVAAQGTAAQGTPARALPGRYPGAARSRSAPRIPVRDVSLGPRLRTWMKSPIPRPSRLQSSRVGYWGIHLVRGC